MSSGFPKPLTTPTPSPLPLAPLKSALRLPSNININSQKNQRRGSSCAPFIKALMSHISGYPTGTHTHAHAHTYAHSHRHTDWSIYCAYGQAEHIRHIKLEDAIKRVKSIASACVCVCVCDSFLCICGRHRRTHTHVTTLPGREPFVSKLVYVLYMPYVVASRPGLSNPANVL